MRSKTPASQPAKICEINMLPGSRLPRMREPITKSHSPARIGSSNCPISDGTSLPSPSMKTKMPDPTSAAATPAAHARPYPLCGRCTPLAPAVDASAAVASVLPLSTTMHSRIRSQGSSRTTAAMFSASFSAGITTETPCRPKSEAPAQPTIGAGRGRLRTEQCAPEFLVLFTIPDLTHGLLRRVAQGEAVVAAHGEWRDATGKRLSVGRDVHQAPGTAAERPWAVVLPLLDADLRLGRARRAEEHAQLVGDGFGSLQNLFLLAGGVFKQCLFWPRQPLSFGQIDHPLQIDLHHAEAMGQANKGLQLCQRLAQAGKPEGNTR